MNIPSTGDGLVVPIAGARWYSGVILGKLIAFLDCFRSASMFLENEVDVRHELKLPLIDFTMRLYSVFIAKRHEQQLLLAVLWIKYVGGLDWKLLIGEELYKRHQTLEIILINFYCPPQQYTTFLVKYSLSAYYSNKFN